jgi:adenine-specific DNA-methyltransferase
MGAKYPYYYLADTPEGRAKEQELTGRVYSGASDTGDIRLGFVYDRAPHIMLKDVASNAAIDVIWEEAQEELTALQAQLNDALGKKWE